MSVKSLQENISTLSLDEIREQAAQWVVHLDEAEPDIRMSLEKECERWQSTTPQHRKIFTEILEMWNTVNKPAETVTKQKHVVGIIMLLVSILSLSLLPWSYWSADYQTRVGEVAEIILPDNSIVFLNTNSAINVNYTKKSRNIVLEKGELFVEVNKDANQRPFSVLTKNGNATALGTKYLTKLDENYTTVSVVESSVLIEPKDSSHQHLKLIKGQQVDFSREYVSEPREIEIKNPDWIQNRIVFNNESIDSVISKLSEYHSGWLYLSEEVSTDSLRFTGLLPTNDIGLAMTTLAQSMNLKVNQVTPYIIWLEKY